MGFTRWHANIADRPTPHAYGWTPDRRRPSQPGADNPTGPGWGQANGIKTGVMFLGTDTGNFPWDTRTGSSSIVDGSSTTILATENILAGASNGDPLHRRTSRPTGPARTPTSSASSPPTRSGPAARRQPGRHRHGNPQSTAPAGSYANTRTRPPAANAPPLESINYGLNLSDEGTFPFPNSNHAGGVNVLFCDGSVKFISATRSTAPSTPS